MQLTICGREEAYDRLKKPEDFTHVISISDAKREVPAVEGVYKVKKRLVLSFDDVSIVRKGYREPRAEDVERILRLAATVDDKSSLLCHCEQGISRSTAAAFIVLCDRFGPKREAEAMSFIINCQEGARPNELMVEIADQLMKRGGAMVKELELARMMRHAMYFQLR